MWLHARMRYKTHKWMHPHISMDHIHIVEIHTPLRRTYSGPFHSLNIPLAVSHRRPQLLLISWVTRHSRWASALGGSRNSQHILCPLSSILNIPSRPVLRHPPQRLRLDSLSYSGPAILGTCISKALTFPEFYELTFSIVRLHALSVLKRALCAFGERHRRMCFYSLRKVVGVHCNLVFLFLGCL